MGSASKLMPLEGNHLTIPSTIFFDFGSDRTLFGRQALSAYVAGAEGRMMRSLKSVLGSSLASESTRIKRKLLPFLDVLGLFLAELKRRAESQLGTAIDEVVVGRPVRFVDGDDAADRAAQEQLGATVRAQGFSNVAFQFEPIAAALDYEQRINREELSFIIDLGGGTSDFSIVRVSPERAQAVDRQSDVLATTGVHIGGTDFDRMLSLSQVMPEFGYRTPTGDGKRSLPSAPYYDLATWHRINRLYAPEVMAELRSTRREARDPWRVEHLISVVSHREGHALAGAVEAAKIALTDSAATEFEFKGEAVHLLVQITRSQVAEALRQSIDRIEATMGETLRRAGLEAPQIDTLILTGGSTQVPAVRDRIQRLFPETRLVETDAFGSVGLGLALDARRKFG